MLQPDFQIFLCHFRSGNLKASNILFPLIRSWIRIGLPDVVWVYLPMSDKIEEPGQNMDHIHVEDVGTYHKHLCMKEKKERTYMVAPWSTASCSNHLKWSLSLVSFYTAFVVCVWALSNMHRRVTVVLVVHSIFKEIIWNFRPQMGAHAWARARGWWRRAVVKALDCLEGHHG